ncbi:hypothetical protein MEQU1_003215 [Malassezia equina]|uniref:GH16 domain-containing protein n=1 Tax=Malassezia equina TaxID=1381935 RepID=A0AAF0EHG6_9BASI|nr:hypothetical protein MEQU1_003215 [Malassezia equina]
MAFALPRKSRGDRHMPSPGPSNKDRAHELQSVLHASSYRPSQPVPSSTPHIPRRPQAFAQDVSTSLTPSTPRRALRPYGEFPAPNWSASRQSASSTAAATPVRSPRAPAPMTILDDDDADRDAPTASFARDYVEAPPAREPFAPTRPSGALGRAASPHRPMLAQAPPSPVSSTDDPLLLHDPSRPDLSMQAAQGDASLLAMVRRFEREDLGMTSITATPRKRPLSSFRDDTPRRARISHTLTPRRSDARSRARPPMEGASIPSLYDRSIGVSQRVARLRSPEKARASPAPADRPSASPAPTWAPDWEPSFSRTMEMQEAASALDVPDMQPEPAPEGQPDAMQWESGLEPEAAWDPAWQPHAELPAEAEREEAEREAERQEAEREEAEREEAEREEAERIEAEIAEAERIEAERAEAERAEAERAEAERIEAERLEAERLEAERLEAERIEAERIEAERIEAERIEAERLEAARLEAERLEAERIEAERLEAERIEAERIEAERIEAERIEAERLEAERLEEERLEAERIEEERLEAERVEAERIKAERLEAERLEEERLEAERVEAERIKAERAEAERLETEQQASAPRAADASSPSAVRRSLRPTSEAWFERSKSHIRRPSAPRRRARSSQAPVYMDFDHAMDQGATLPLSPSPRRSMQREARHDTSWFERAGPSHEASPYTPRKRTAPAGPSPWRSSPYKMARIEAPKDALAAQPALAAEPAVDTAWLDAPTDDASPPASALDSDDKVDEVLEQTLEAIDALDEELRHRASDEGPWPPPEDAGPDATAPPTLAMQDAPLHLDDLMLTDALDASVAPRARTPTPHAVSLEGARARQTPSPRKSGKAQRVAIYDHSPVHARAARRPPVRSAKPSPVARSSSEVVARRAASVPPVVPASPAAPPPLPASAPQEPSLSDISASLSASLASRAMMLARPYPTSCIEVSSLNPAAAARAAAILKVHHRYIQEGYLGDSESLYPPLPGDVSQTLPALLDAAEQALRPATNALRAQARSGTWSNEAWAQLDDHVRAHIRVPATADVDVDEVIVSFLDALRLEPDDLQGAWSLTRLYARVPALQARYLREQEQDAAEAMRERSFQWLSQRTKRTCDTAQEAHTDAAPSEGPPCKRVRAASPLWTRLWDWVAGRSTPPAEASHAQASIPSSAPTRPRPRSRLPRPRTGVAASPGRREDCRSDRAGAAPSSIGPSEPSTPGALPHRQRSQRGTAPFRSMRVGWLSALLGVVRVLAASCGPGRPCPANAPCCSATGECGAGAAQCTSGCQPMLSQAATACVSNAVCAPMDVAIQPGVYTDASVFRPLMQYNGDASATPFVFESGYLGRGMEGILLEMNAAHESRISTSRYLLYGNVTARLRHNATTGLVASFGTASDVGDAIVFVMGGTNTSRVATNLAALGHAPSALGVDANVPHFSFEQWHNYSIAWTPNHIAWSIDQHVVRTVQRSHARSHFPRSPSRVLFTLRGITPSSSQRERQWAGGLLNLTRASFRSRGYYAQELSHLQVSCADLSLSNVSVTGVGDAPIAYYYTGHNSSVSREPAFQLSRDQIRLLAHPTDHGKPGMPGWPGAAPNGPRPNMYTGGTGRGGPSSPSSPPSVSNGVKIGVPLAVGLVALVGVLAILAFYFVRRHQRAKRRPPSTIDPVSPGLHPTGVLDASYPLAAYPPEARDSMSFDKETPDTSWMMQEVVTPHESHDKDDMYPHHVDVPDDVDSDEASIATEGRQHMHYAGHDSVRRYDSRRPEADKERLAAQEAWHELRCAALGDDVPTFPSSYAETSDTPFRARRGAHRAAYSEGGALSPSLTHTPTLSMHGATGWNPRAQFDSFV